LAVHKQDANEKWRNFYDNRPENLSKPRIRSAECGICPNAAVCTVVKMLSLKYKMPGYRRDHHAMHPIYECPENNLSAKSADDCKNLHITILSLFRGEIIFEVFHPM